MQRPRILKRRESLAPIGTRATFEAIIQDYGIDRYKIIEDTIRRVVTVVVPPEHEDDVEGLREALESHRPIHIKLRVKTGVFPKEGPYR